MNNENNTTEVKRGRGRPIVETCTRILRRDPKTGKIFGKGRVTEGTKVECLTVHRSWNSVNYKEGVTPVIKRETVEFHSEKKATKPVSVHVNIIEPSQNVESVEHVEISQTVMA